MGYWTFWSLAKLKGEVMHNISEKTILQTSDSVQNSSTNVHNLEFFGIFCLFLEEKSNRENHFLEADSLVTSFQKLLSSVSEEFCY